MSLYKIARLYVETEPHFEPLRGQMEKYKTAERVRRDLAISTDEALHERLRASFPEIPREEWEYMTVGKAFNTAILNFAGIYLHSSCIEYEGRAYLFSAASGVGKSTHTRLWQTVYGEDKVRYINDDKPVIRLLDGEYRVFGTPFSGKTATNSDVDVPLGGICFIHRCETNFIAKIKAEDALPLFLSQTIMPKEPALSDKMISFTDKLLKAAPLWQLDCNPTADAARVAHDAMTKR